ncbi:spore germination protein [Alkaliphilus crotonatoxidans]
MKRHKKNLPNQEVEINITRDEINSRNLSKDLKDNYLLLRAIFRDSNDIIFRRLSIFSKGPSEDAFLIFTDGLVDSENIYESIIEPLNHYREQYSNTVHYQGLALKNVKSIITNSEIEEVEMVKEVVNGVLSGDTVLIIEGSKKALMLNTKGWDKRNIEEPTVERVVRGSREGFTESIRSNTGLIRRKLKDPALKIYELKVGNRSQTFVSIFYIDDIVNKEVLNKIIHKITNIKIDGIFESGYIEQQLEKSPYSPFPQMQITERPDKVCANLLEGRIVVMVDGAPQALIMPISFISLFQSPEDYNERILFGNLTRFLRFIGFFIATSFPSIYVALISFHQEMLPTGLILDLSRSRAQVPFPPVVEAILMEVTVDLLREASARLPGTIGQTIGIVGAIVIGDAAVKANLASPAMVIVVAITAIGSYVLPHYSTSFSLRAVRFPMIFMAASFGAFGIIISWTWIVIHLCRLDSFGYPYLSPMAPLNRGIFKDGILRNTLRRLRTRPSTTNKKNIFRW